MNSSEENSAPLMTSVSGVRGIYGKSLTPSVFSSYISAFVSVLTSPSVAIGRDSRVSGQEFYDLALSILRSHNITVFSLGIVPTPTVQLAVLRHNTGGGIVITASHNPIEWNGIKFIDSDGLFCSPDICNHIYRLAPSIAVDLPTLSSLNTANNIVNHVQDSLDAHIDSILNIPGLSIDHVTRRKLKIALDTVNGAGGPIMHKLLTRLGCEVVAINSETSGLFNHPPEPIPEHLHDLGELVLSHGCDLGIATDPDVDRCVLVGSDGVPLGEELTLVIAVDYFLSLEKRARDANKTLVKNCSTSALIDVVADKHGYNVVETAVGEINVAKEMQKMGAAIGGEGNGGVMCADCHIGRDAPVAATLVICALAAFNGSILDLRSKYPVFEMLKTKRGVEASDSDFSRLLPRLHDVFTSPFEVSTVDGVKLFSKAGGVDRWWVHIRKSNTEPIVRIIAECGPSSVYTCRQMVDMVSSLL
ncbi:hypothetical protein RCL1_005865 [Eukaryota sp. TZLM3-RCL]